MTDDELHAKFLECRQQIDKAGKKEYEEIYKRMVDKLCPSLLKPFDKILQEKDGYHMDWTSAMDSLKASLLPALLDVWNKQFWDPVAVDKLANLELLKDNFATNEGQNCQIKTKTPEERLLPAQMRYAKKRLDILNAQTEAQTNILERKYAQANKRRLFLQKIEEEGMQLQERIGHLMKMAPQEEEMLKNMFGDMLRNDAGPFAPKPNFKEEF